MDESAARLSSPRRSPLLIAMAQPVLQLKSERTDGVPRSSVHVDGSRSRGADRRDAGGAVE